MDQQQAVEFTQKALARGATPEQVAYVLAERMNAPVEAILRFVQRIAAQPVSEAVTLVEPPEMASLDAAPPAEFAPSQVDLEPAEETSFGEEAVLLVDESSAAAPMEEEPPTLIQGFPVPPPPPPVAAAPEYAPEAIMPTAEISTLTPPEDENSPAPEAAEAQPAPAVSEPRSRGRVAVLYQTPGIQDQVLQDLKRRRNQSDIALKLSEQYGVRWNDAQRFVAEVATRNHASLQRKTNFILLFFSALSLLAGLVLLATGGISAVDGLLGQTADRWSQVAGTLVGGGLLTLGGAIGLYITLRPPSD